MNRMPVSVEVDVTAEAEAEGARRATGASVSAVEPAPRVPDPEVSAKVQRRRFSVEYRLRIVKQADACKKPGELGALLRREGLYSSQLSKWRMQYERGASQALADDTRGRKSTRNPLDEEVQRLRRQNIRLEHRLKQAETIIEIQKKVSELLGIPLASTGEAEGGR